MGNRRRKKFNPKYSALSWNIHNKKKIEEEEQQLEKIYNDLVEIKEMVVEKKRNDGDENKARACFHGLRSQLFPEQTLEPLRFQVFHESIHASIRGILAKQFVT